MLLYDWLEESSNLLVALLEDILVVEPNSLLECELSTSLRTLADIEQRNKLIERENLLLSTWVPSQQSQEVDNSLREVAILAITTRCLTALWILPQKWEHWESQTISITLRKFTLTIGLKQQWQVSKLWHGVLPTESTIQHYVQWSRRQPLLTTDNVRDFHQVVVYNICQVISWQLVSTLIKYLVITDITLNTYFTTNQVVNQNLLTSLNLEANNILLTLSNQLINLLLRHSQRVTHLTTGVTIVLEVLDFSTLCLQLLWSIKSNICLIGIEQLLNIFLIDIATLALAIWTFVTTKAYTLIELDAKPLKRLNNIFLGTWDETIRIGILNTENQVATMLLGKQIIIQGGTHTADVQRTRWAGCKTYSYSSF